MTIREKLIFIRKLLNARQKDLARNNITREFISMVESGKRNMSRDVSIDIMRNAIEFAKENKIELNYDEEFIARTEEEDLCVICEKLPSSEESLEKCHYIEALSKNNNMHWPEIYAIKKKGDIYVGKQEYDKAVDTYRKCLNSLDKIGSTALKQDIYNNLGIIKDRCLQYYDAVMYYQEALNYCYINNDFTKKDRINYNIGLAYYSISDYEKSLYTLQRLLRDDCEQLPYYSKARLLQGAIFYKLKKIPEALDVFEKLLNYGNLNSELLFRIYNNIALCHMEEKKYDKAEIFFDKAMEVARGQRKFLYEVLGDKGGLYFELQRYEKGKKVLNESIEISEEIGDYKYQLECLRLLYKIAVKEKDEGEIEKILLKILKLSNDTNSKDEVIWSMKKLLDLAVEQGDLKKVKLFNNYIKESD